MKVSNQNGFALIALLIALVILAMMATSSVEPGIMLRRQDAEEQLLRVGNTYRHAIASYVAATPMGTYPYPATLQDLLRDPRFPEVRRHLRDLYADPITASDEWGIVQAPGGGIVGVYSQSNAAPLKVAQFPVEVQFFADKKKYSEWLFVITSDGGSTVGAPESFVSR